MAARKLSALLGAVLQLCLCQIPPEAEPEFLAPLENYTVTQGRDIFFTCVVNHLQSYKVAWIKSDSRAILAIHTHMVAHNPRLSVTHNGHNTWKLHVSNVQKNDSGTYMCQVNTDPMRSQMGYMVVVIPPDILDDESSNGVVAHEGGKVELRCKATGSPKPSVTWRREDGRNIIVRHETPKAKKTYEGETLELTGVLRQDMGSYLCIASNGVPPAVSKRYSVQVNFQPLIKVTNQLVAAPINSDVVLQCYVEASPRAMNTWYKETTGEKLLPSGKYMMTDSSLSDYTRQMNLTVRSLDKTDFVSYVCSAENALGKAEGVVRLKELNLPVQTTPATMTRKKGTKPREKQNGHRVNITPVNSRRPYGEMSEHEDRTVGRSKQNPGTTQIYTDGSTPEKPRTEGPPTEPSLSPPWVILNSASSRTFCAFENAILLLPFMVTL